MPGGSGADPRYEQEMFFNVIALVKILAFHSHFAVFDFLNHIANRREIAHIACATDIYTDEVFHLDMLGDSTISNAMSRLIDSSRTEVQGLAFDVVPRAGDPLAELGFLFRLYKGSDSLGWSTEEFGGEQYTVTNLYLDISPVRLPRPLYGQWPVPAASAAGAQP